MTSISPPLPLFLEYESLIFPDVFPKKNIREKISSSLKPAVACRLQTQPHVSMEYLFILYAELLKGCSEVAVDWSPTTSLVLFSRLPNGLYTRPEAMILIPELILEPTSSFVEDVGSEKEIDLGKVATLTEENLLSEIQVMKEQASFVQTLRFVGETDPVSALVSLAIFSRYAEEVFYHETRIF